jgi:hypothetical protein
MLFQTRPKEAQNLRMSRRIDLILFELHALYGGLSVGAQKGHAIITDSRAIGITFLPSLGSDDISAA